MVVVLKADGLGMSNRYSSPPIPVTFPQLLLVSELQANDYVSVDQAVERISTTYGVQPETMLQFARGMNMFGRFRRRKLPIPNIDVPLATVSASADVVWPATDELALKVPLALRVCNGTFQLIDHDGHLVIGFSAAELIAISQFVRPIPFTTGLEDQRRVLTDHAVTADRLSEMLSILENSRLLSRIEPTGEVVVAAPPKLSRSQANKANFARQSAQQDEKEALRRQQTGVSRPKVIPVWSDEGIPAALGVIVAYAMTYDGGKLDEFYDFRLNWVWDDDRLENYTASPAIYLCSNYLWSHEKSIAVSAMVKRLSPGSITIHGGPDTPKYEQDAKEYFARFPQVDIVVRGEGEASAADTLDKLRSVIGSEQPDLSVLRDVPGITYRCGDEIIRNPDRPRIEDLDTIPSPYLMGLFDAYKDVPRLHATLETNRGCPYGCTFCDWGSATTSKIRKFDIDRVFGELEWCSAAKVQSVSQADANFGVFERDVSIAQRVRDLKMSTGYPEAFGGSYAKNSTKYLQKIIKVMAEAGILTQGVLSLQTMDENTLSVIKRSNIKVEKYDALANEMRDSNLQLCVELMMGLPGATLQSFADDLQQCIDRDIPARVNHTTLLINSPMNHPDYRAEHQITTRTEPGPGKMPVLVSTKTYTEADLDMMYEIRQVYFLLDNFGVLRLCARFVRQQTGMTEIDFYRKLINNTGKMSHEEQWPMLNTLVTWGQHLMAPIFSWKLVLDELRLFLVQQCDILDDSALDAILMAQHALLPAHGREFPFSVDLPHDVVAWYSQMIAAKAAGHWRDWQLMIPPLCEFDAGRLEVNDKQGWVTGMLGCDIDIVSVGVNWDMESGLARSRVDQTFNHAWQSESDEIVRVG